jgi:hypothetical protein
MGGGMIFARPPVMSLPQVPVTLAVAAATLWWTMPLAAESIGPVAGLSALAMAVHHLLTRLDAPQPDRAAALLLLLPSVLLGAGLPGPSDALWAVPCLIALAALVERRHAAMLGWFGLALGLSAQALLIAPFFLALLINRRVPFRLWPIAPSVAVATMLTLWTVGRPGFDLPMSGYPALSSDAPNVWAILQALPLGLPLIGLALAAAIGATAAYTARFSAQILDKRALLSAALLAPLVVAGLLPGMSGRCFLLADILALTLALTYRDNTSWTVTILVQAGSILALLGSLSGIAGLAMLGGAVMIVATLRVARSLLNRAANDNPLMVRTI